MKLTNSLINKEILFLKTCKILISIIDIYTLKNIYVFKLFWMKIII
jgi:hypothetical protein